MAYYPTYPGPGYPTGNQITYPNQNGTYYAPSSNPFSSMSAPAYQAAPMQAAYSPINQNMKWVQGRAGAEAYMLEPNSRAVLFDSESQKFYIKEVGADGRPQPLMVFKYEAVDLGRTEERMASEQSPDMSKYVTKEDFNKLKEMLEDLTRPSEDKHGNSAIR